MFYNFSIFNFPSVYNVETFSIISPVFHSYRCMGVKDDVIAIDEYMFYIISKVWKSLGELSKIINQTIDTVRNASIVLSIGITAVLFLNEVELVVVH